MGKDPKTALRLSELASRFQNIADTEIDAATSAKFINSQLKAFGDTKSLQKFTGDFEKAEHVIDATNEVANNFAVGTNDLQNALTKAGSAMSVAGNSFEETIAMVTAGTEIMVGQPAKVGRGLRTIAINISKLAQEQETLSIANGKYTITLQNQNGEMKSTFDIMSQIGKVWGKLNETEQTALATQLAGKTQFEVFTNVMKNWGTVVGNGKDKIGALNTALNANGSSMRENEKYLDSIEGKIQAFQSAWEQLSYHVMSSDFIKGVIDLGTDLIKILDTLVQKIGTIPTLLGLLGTAFGAMKLGKLASNFLGITNAMTETAEATEAVTTAASAASGAKGLGGLSKVLGVLTSPTVLGGLAALGVAIAAIEFDKYFSFDSSLKRLGEYEDKLQDVTSEIDALNKKRDSEGLTNAEKTHLAVLKAEERSLERQIKLEQQRIQNAFKKDVSTNQGGRYQGRTGPTQLLDYQDSRKKELDLDKQIVDVENQIADARKKAQYYRMTGDDQGVSTWEVQAQAYEKQLEKLGQKYTKLDVDAAKAASNLAAYWEEVSANVDYDSLGKVEKEKFDEIHKAFLESQIDASNLKDSYTDVANVLNSAMDSLGHDNLNLFDNIDISSIETVENAISAIKKQIKSLGDDTEITFQVKDEDGSIETYTKKVSELTDKDYEGIIHFNETGISEVDAEADEAAQARDSVVNVTQEGAEAVSGIIDDAAKARDSNISVSQTGASTAKSDIDSAAKNRTTVISVITSGISAVKKALSGIGHASGKRKGEEGGLAWLGDEGSSKSPKPELVVSEDGTAYLAGTTGWELHSLKDSDTVYSYSDTKKLLGNRQSFIGTVDKIPRYKTGKKTEKQKKREEFDRKLEKLEHKRKVNHWTDKKFRKEYKKLYDEYKKWLNRDRKYAYSEQREGYENQRDTDIFEDRANNIVTKSDLDKYITSVKKNKNLSATEKNELIRDAKHSYYSNRFQDKANDITSYKGLKGYIKSIRKNKTLSKQEKQNLIQSAKHEYYSNRFQDKANDITSYKGLKGYIKSVKKNKTLSNQEKKELIQSARHEYYSNKFQDKANDITSYADLKNYIQSVKKNKHLSGQEKQSFIQNAGSRYYSDEFNRRLGILSARGASTKNGKNVRLKDLIADIKKNKYLTKEEKVEYARQAYETVAQYNLKAYQNGVKTRKETLKSIKDYYKQVGKYDENYYNMLDELREADRQKEIDRLTKLKETSENRLTLAQKYIQRELDGINKEIDAEKESEEHLEKLTELEKDLAKAKSRKIRVYREGIGFIYESDVEAVEEAEKALNEYNKSLEKSTLEQRRDELQSILDLFDDIANDQEIKDLEVLLGVAGLANLTGGNLGTNIAQWTNWIKSQTSTSSGLSDLINILNGLDTTQIDTWLGGVLTGDGKLSDSKINSYINQHSFATGTLSAPGGLSRVAERLGGELVWLGKGDSVYSNAVSRNLMEWGRYNPAQVMNSSNSAQNQVFNFDKIVLPNVHNAQDFYRELQNLPNKALQQSTRRV